jgi:hypothetical protein
VAMQVVRAKARLVNGCRNIYTGNGCRAGFRAAGNVVVGEGYGKTTCNYAGRGAIACMSSPIGPMTRTFVRLWAPSPIRNPCDLIELPAIFRYLAQK